MNFTKAETNGNDFVIIHGVSGSLSRDEKRTLPDRKFGIGCDQLIFVKELDTPEEYSIEFFNQDGSCATMCGNGACAAVRYIARKFLNIPQRLTLHICDTRYNAALGNDGSVSVSFPKPYYEGEVILTGNRHLVFDMEEVTQADALAQQHPDCNLHFVSQVADDIIKVKTFERGVGWTLACGSGAVAGGFHSGIQGKVHVIHGGGQSTVEITQTYATLTTKPRLVFDGILCEPDKV
jgi:diaminopimelate epimerase